MGQSRWRPRIPGEGLAVGKEQPEAGTAPRLPATPGSPSCRRAGVPGSARGARAFWACFGAFLSLLSKGFPFPEELP